MNKGGDKFIVLASDGVWEFISSQEAIEIVNASLEEGTMKVQHMFREMCRVALLSIDVITIPSMH